MATATRKATFGVSCPECGENDAITLNLNDLSAPCRCDSCSEEFTPAEALAKATEKMKAWERVVRFVEFGRELASE